MNLSTAETDAEGTRVPSPYDRAGSRVRDRRPIDRDAQNPQGAGCDEERVRSDVCDVRRSGRSWAGSGAHAIQEPSVSGSVRLLHDRIRRERKGRSGIRQKHGMSRRDRIEVWLISGCRICGRAILRGVSPDLSSEPELCAKQSHMEAQCSTVGENLQHLHAVHVDQLPEDGREAVGS